MKKILKFCKHVLFFYVLWNISLLSITDILILSSQSKSIYNNLSLTSSAKANFYIFLIIILNVLLLICLCNKIQVRFFPFPKWTKKDFKLLLDSIMITKIIAIFGIYFLHSSGLTSTENDTKIMDFLNILTPFNFSMQIIIASPIMEELIYRSVIMNYCFKNQPYIAIVVNVFLFGLVHSPNHLASWFIYAGIGFLLSLVYHKTKRLDLSIAIHVVYNFISITPVLF